MPYLLTSITSLRRHWSGPVAVYCWPESVGMAHQIAADDRLGIEVKKWEPGYKGKNAQFLNKILVMGSHDHDLGLYLDADTIINDPLGEGVRKWRKI